MERHFSGLERATWRGVRVRAALCIVLAAIGCRQPVRSALEATLRVDLRTMRECIVQFRANVHRCPLTLPELVRARYLVRIPVDPLTGRSDTWVEVKGSLSAGPCAGRLLDVHSGASGSGSDATPYSTW